MVFYLGTLTLADKVKSCRQIWRLKVLRKHIFACLFSVYNTISLSRHEQVWLMKLRFERYFFHHRTQQWEKSSVIRQKGESQSGCFKMAKHAKISEKQTFLTS